jgi:hypothetical protein
MEDPQPDLAEDTRQPQNQAAIDAAHGSTGWNAYQVWRNRVFTPAPKADGKAGKL